MPRNRIDRSQTSRTYSLKAVDGSVLSQTGTCSPLRARCLFSSAPPVSVEGTLKRGKTRKSSIFMVGQPPKEMLCGLRACTGRDFPFASTATYVKSPSVTLTSSPVPPRRAKGLILTVLQKPPHLTTPPSHATSP